jgi:hypothetical protein
MRALVHHSLILLIVLSLLEDWVADLMADAKWGRQLNLLAPALVQITVRFLFPTVRGGLLDHGEVYPRALND